MAGLARRAQIEAGDGFAGDVVVGVDKQRRAVDAHDLRGRPFPGLLSQNQRGEQGECGNQSDGEHLEYCRIAKLKHVAMSRRALLAVTPGLAWAQGGAGLRLSGEADRKAVRRWIVWLAEALYSMQPNLPADVKDCSGFVRFCFRESMKRHDREWAGQLGLDGIPAMPDARSAIGIHARMGGAVFRVRPGQYRPGDERNGSYRHFADAENLMRYNCRRVAGALEAGRPGDVLFYRQLTSAQPFHSMVVTGEAVVYHTGPEGSWAGEVRRLGYDELRRHQQAKWRPVAGNSNYLGVFGWTLLERG